MGRGGWGKRLLALAVARARRARAVLEAEGGGGESQRRGPEERARAPYAPAAERAPGRRGGGRGGVSSGVEGSCGRGGENNMKGNGMGVEGEARAPAGELLLVREAGRSARVEGEKGESR